MYVWLRHLCIGPKGPLLKIAQFWLQGVVAAAASQRSPCCQNAKYTRGVERDMLLGGWVAGWLRPREALRGPERWSVNKQSLSCAWLETTRQAPHRFLYGTQEEAPADYH